MKKKLLYIIIIVLLSLFNINTVNAEYQKGTCTYKDFSIIGIEKIDIIYEVSSNGDGTVSINNVSPNLNIRSGKITFDLTDTDFVNDEKTGIRCPYIRLIDATKDDSDMKKYQIKRTVETNKDAVSPTTSNIDNNPFIDTSTNSSKGGTCILYYDTMREHDIIIKYDGTNPPKITGGPDSNEGVIFNIVGDFDSISDPNERNKAKKEFYDKKFGNYCQGKGTLKVDCEGGGLDTTVCRIYDSSYQDQYGSLHGKDVVMEENSSLKTSTEACVKSNLGAYYCKNKLECTEEQFKKECVANQDADFGDVCKDGGCDIDIEDICEKPNVARTLKFVGLLVNIVKIIVPAIIIIMGIINLFNIITSGNDVADAKKYAKNIATRVLIGVLIFLIPGLINFVYDEVMKITGISNSGKDKLSNCVNCILDVDNCDVND